MMMKARKFRFRSGGSLIVCVSLLALSCGPRAESPEQKAARERLAAARARTVELAAELKRSDLDAASRVGDLEELLKIQAMDIGALDEAVAAYRENEDILNDSYEARIYWAVALSMKAGQVEKIEDKLGWLRKGMKAWDDLNRDFPENEMVLLYQASTYANFPAEVGAKREVLDILDVMYAKYRSLAWKLEPGIADQLWYAYAQLLRNYPASDKNADVSAHARAAAASIPGLGERPGAKDFIHG
jgi:hypothetical protein